MSWDDEGSAASRSLQVSLGVQLDGLRVAWRLSGVFLPADEVVAVLPLSIAGAPTITLPGEELSVRDELGALPVSAVDEDSEEEGEGQRVWTTARASTGAITVDYLAQPTDAEPRAATPPLELRREGGGFSGALKTFLVLPPGPEDLAFELRWQNASTAEEPCTGWMAATSWGEGDGSDGSLAGVGLERLGDTYMMCGDLTQRHVRDGQLSIWWLTRPGIDVTAFMDRLGTTYQVMSETFDAPAHPYRVFFRTHPHRGVNGSAHPASFVLGVNPEEPVAMSRLYETLAHEWLYLDGPDREVRWFNEGAAEYYSLVVPHRAGLVDDATFLGAVNLEARAGYANPRQHLNMADAERLFFTDFFAHWLPYTRGMFYLADLDARLRRDTSGRRSLDHVVVEVTHRRRDGERTGIAEWCTIVDQTLTGNERRMLDQMVFTGEGRPGPETFAPRFEMFEDCVPSLELGFDPLTLVSRRVTGLVPGGPADRAGLRDDDTVEVPGFYDVLALNVNDLLTLHVTRDGHQTHVDIPMSSASVTVPQWRLDHTRPGQSGQSKTAQDTTV
jgi:predicted metalloprotease with PDZ domain